MQLSISCGYTIRQTCKGLSAKVRNSDSEQYLLWWCRQHEAVHDPADCSNVFEGLGWGSTSFLSSQILFDTEGGFMQGQEMVVGVHISAIQPVGISMHRHILLVCL